MLKYINIYTIMYCSVSKNNVDYVISFVVHTHTHTAILECYRAHIPCFPSAAMLTIHKNRVVSDVTLQQAAVRQKEPGSVGWRFLLYTTVIIVDRTTVS